MHQAIIRKHVESLGGRVELDTELVGLDQDETSVRAKIKKVRDGQAKEEDVVFDYVVGADGAKGELISLRFVR